ncbi:MAG: phenylacetate--CoA ligase family protein [Alphaproteobacteria bacterium]
MNDIDYFDADETRDPAVREAALFAALPAHLTRAKKMSPGWAEWLAQTDSAEVTSREALARLPVLRKSDLHVLQVKDAPMGGFATITLGSFARLFASPGPIFEVEGRGANWWRAARALHGAGLRAGDIVHNTFSYHLTPGGFMLDGAARHLGCAVIPAGTGNTDAQIEVISAFKPTAYIGTPDFLKILLDKARALGKDTTSFTRAVVSGAPLFASMKDELNHRGIVVRQCYATADLGLIAYETCDDVGMVIDEDLIVEIVRPGTGTLVAQGEIGEVLVTSFNQDYPMFRFATGDLSALLPGASPCGRTGPRLRGWLGRADQATKVKGMFVRPEQLAELGKRHREIGRLRLTITRQNQNETMTLSAECTAPTDELGSALEASLRDLTKLRGTIVLVAPGSLPNDGLVIADERDITN